MIRVIHSVSNMDRAGIETMIMNYYRHMDRDKVQFDFWANKSKPGAYEDEIARLGGRVYRSPGLNPLKFPAYVKAMKKLFADNPDITMLHAHNGPLGLYSLIGAKAAGKKIRVYHAHSTRIPPDKAWLLKFFCKPFIKYEATRLLACGEKAGRFYYGNKLFDAGKVTLITNAIEPDRFVFNADTRERMRSENRLDGNVVVGHVGRMSAAKNHKRMLEIFMAFKKREPRAILVLLGDGELEKDVRAYADKLGMTDGDVRFMGNVPNVNEWYQAMDVFLMPSIFEGQPVVGVEAQAAGLPCVLSDVITREAKITPLMRFVSLELPDDKWAAEIESALRENPTRLDTREAIRAAGYDIAAEAPRLQALYEKYAAEEKEG